MKRHICWIDGEIVPGERATISPFDLGLLRGLAIFDYFRIYDGVAYHLDRHLDRFFASAERMKIAFGATRREVESAVAQLTAENGGGSYAVRIVATGGVSVDGFTPPGRGSLMILFENGGPIIGPDAGIKLITSEYLRPFPGVKSTCYLNAEFERDRMLAADAAETLLTWRGQVLECTKSNFFIFKRGRLITAVDDILHGVTRGVLIELGKKMFPVEVRDVAVEELAEADEAFISGTTPKVTPVVAIDGRSVGTGLPGQKTIQLRASFVDYFESYLQARKTESAA